MKKTVSIAVPCYNEEDNIEELYQRVNAVMSKLPQYDYEFVFVDNKSQDRSREILKELAEKDNRVKVIFNQGNFGPEASGAHVLLSSSGDAVISIACDLQNPPELIPQFIEKWEEGSKLVLGRYVESENHGPLSAFRNLYYKLVSRFSGSTDYDNVTGFGLYDKSVVNELRASGDPCPNYRLTFMRYGYHPEFVDYTKYKRSSGKSSYNFMSYMGLAVESIATVSRRPTHIITAAGAVSSIIFLLVFIAMLILGIAFRDFVFFYWLGIALVCLGLSLLTLALGIVGVYIALAFEWARSAPLVIEEERLNWREREEGDTLS